MTDAGEPAKKNSLEANLMPIEHVPDWEQRIRRQDAFWDREIIDRPVVVIEVSRQDSGYPRPPGKQWASERERWLDAEFVAESALASAMNTEYYGDALPRVWPNLGPEVFSAFFGAEMEYGPSTSWSVPNLHDWSEADKLRFSEDNFYWQKLHEMTDALLEAGRGRFYTGITDLHPGGDAIAAFRDPFNLNIDIIEHPAEVNALLRRVTDAYFKVYDFCCQKITAAGQPVTTWLPIVSTKKWYVPSNDFSCMISKAMFDDVFLPGIAEECRHFEASIYHLDGPGALRHLDSLLDIKQLNAVQWVWGDGHGRASDWMHVYERCQAAGKGIEVGLDPDELDVFIEKLRPEGLWIFVSGIRDGEHADAVIKKITRWR